MANISNDSAPLDKEDTLTKILNGFRDRFYDSANDDKSADSIDSTSLWGKSSIQLLSWRQ